MKLAGQLDRPHSVLWDARIGRGNLPAFLKGRQGATFESEFAVGGRNRCDFVIEGAKDSLSVR
jgi:hypothetical protein